MPRSTPSTVPSLSNVPSLSTIAARARLTATVAVVSCTFALSGCGTSTGAADTTPAGSSPSSTLPTPPAEAGQPADLTLDSGWVKAGSGMTAAFGTITNHSSAPVTIITGRSDHAGMVALHTMEKQTDGTMKMTEKRGGFVIPAGGELSLSPGGDHIMLMDLSGTLANGQKVALDLVTADGTTFTWSMPVRSFAGAEETYAPSTPGPPGMTGMTGMTGMAPTTPAQ